MSNIATSSLRRHSQRLAAAVEEADGTRVAISAQNVHWEGEGAFTGEISVRMLLDVGCTYAIIGHSERRQYFGKPTNPLKRRQRRPSQGGLQAIVCVGETLTERDAGQASEVVRRQVPRWAGSIDGLGPFPYHCRLRACMGDRHRAHGNTRNRCRNARRNPEDLRRNLWRGCGRCAPHSCMAEASSRTIFRL